LNRFVLAPLDVLTMLGFVILIGTVVNNPILIVEQALILLRQGVPLREATRKAVRTRVRPIFMTTMTTLLGLLPLVLFPGAGSELYRGLGSVLLGGLLVSTVVTLFVVPAMFGLGVELQTGLSRWWHRPAAPPPPPPGTAQPMRRPESVAVEAT
jgi:HAE1 family hydrophobic/amphiphilic exporter-1